MIEIKDLLGRFKNILLSEQGKKETIQRIITEVTGLKTKPEDIRIKNSTIYLNIKPIYKNEILFKKKEIFRRLEEIFDKQSPNSIH